MMTKDLASTVYLVNRQILLIARASVGHCQKNHWIWHFGIWYVSLFLGLVNNNSFCVQLIEPEVNLFLQDIRRSIPNNLRPLMTSIPASSVHSARSGSTRSRPMSVSDSPLATSSNASSEPSVNNNLMCLDSIDIDDELCSDRAGPYGR
jgi:hypothetical protein